MLDKEVCRKCWMEDDLYSAVVRHFEITWETGMIVMKVDGKMGMYAVLSKVVECGINVM
jgi:hypothetical protein